MNARLSARLAWGLWAMVLAMVGGALVLGVSDQNAPMYEFWLEATLIEPVFATIGALIVARRPGNVIGWIFLLSSIAGGTQFLAGQYATNSLTDPGLVGRDVAAWASSLMQISAVASVLFLILLFPTGTVPSRRWRIVAWVAGAAVTATVVGLAFKPGPIENFPAADNPFGVSVPDAVEVILSTGGILFIASFIAAVVSLIVRFRASHGDERLQITWFVYAATLGFLVILFGSVLAPSSVDERFGTLVWAIAPLGLPISAGLAILRYHLYDIDRIINRTIVYVLVTGSAIAVYAATVFVIGTIVVGPSGDLTVAVATLAAAAVFRPALRRVQRFVDRRFYRHKYDAQHTIDAFGTRLREETDLDELTGDLVGVVRTTMQPEHVTVWLAPTEVAK
jgi:hypothetical protein